MLMQAARCLRRVITLHMTDGAGIYLHSKAVCEPGPGHVVFIGATVHPADQFMSDLVKGVSR